MLTIFSGQEPHQLGIVVPDLDAAMAKHQEVLGRDDWFVVENTPSGGMYGLQYRGAPGSHSERVALIGKSPEIELLQPLTGPSIHMEWLEAGGTGLHHIAYIVPDIATAISEMVDHGYPVLQCGYGFLPDGTGGYAYCDTFNDLGYLIELHEF